MDWTVTPLHTSNLLARNIQVQQPYQSQQPASGFSQANTSTQNSSAYTGNDQATKMHFNTENMVPNQLPSSKTVGSSNCQPLLLKTSVPVTGFGTTQHFVGLHSGSHTQLSSMNVQVTPSTVKNTLPNSHVQIFSPVAPQLSTATPVQRPLNQYIASDIYNNYPQKKCSNSLQDSLFWGSINSSSTKRLPVVKPKYQPAKPQTNTTVPLNKVSSNFVNSQHNSSCLTFPSGQNIPNQINDISSGSTTAMQLQQYASNCVYSTPHTIPNHYTAQVIPQTMNFPPPPYRMPPIQINHGQFILPQPVSNTSNENSQNPQNLVLEQSSASYSVQYGQTLESVPVSRETNEVGRAANSVHGHSAENKSSDELMMPAVESLSNSRQIAGTVPLDKMSAPQTTRITVDDIAKSSGNVLDSLMKSKSITRESLELDMQKMHEIKKKFLALEAAFKLKRKLFIMRKQNSKNSDLSVHNPNLPFPSPNTSQNQSVLLSQDTHPNLSLPSCNTNQKQPILLPQDTNQTFHLSHEATQNPTSCLPHENSQNQSPLHLSCDSSQIQDSSLLTLRPPGHLYPILQELLKGTIDEEMLLNTYVANAERNKRERLLVQAKCSSGSVLDSSGGKFETSVNGMERASRLSPKTFQTVSAQESLACAKFSLEQTSASGKEQLMNMSPMSKGDLFNHFVLNKDKVGTTATKIQPNLQNSVSVQNPAVSSESSQLREKTAKEGSENFYNSRSTCPEFMQQSKDTCLQTPETSFTACNNGSGYSSSDLLAAVPETEIFQRSSVTENSCTVERTCSLEELETSLALWRKSPAASLNNQLGESTKSAMNSSSLCGAEDKKMEYTATNFPKPLTMIEKSSIVVGKNEPSLLFVPSSLGQKLDAVSSSLLKSSEPQVAIVPPLILSKEGIQNEAQEKNLSPMLETMSPVIAEGSVHSLHNFVISLNTDNPRERTACFPSDTDVTVKKVDSDMFQKATKSTEETGIQKAETGTNGSCDLSQRITDALELKKITPHLCSRDSFPPGTNNDITSPVSQKDAPKTNPDVVEPGDTVLNDNILQISSVCTLVQGDAFYNSQIARIFDSSPSKSTTESNTSSEDHRPLEQQLGLQKRESERNGSTPVGDTLLPSLGTLSKAIAEKLLSLPGLKIHQGGNVSDERNVKDSVEEKITYVPKGSPNSGKESEQNKSCSAVHNTDLSSGNQEVPGNKCLLSYVDEDHTHSIQEYVASDENQAHSVNDIDIALTSPNDQLTELLKEFPYGIDSSKTLKKTEKVDSSTKLTETKHGQEAQTCGQNFEANHALDQIIITVLNSQQMKELFPEYDGSSIKLKKDQLPTASEDTNDLNTSAGTVQKSANHSYCCLRGWLVSKYAVDPCACMTAKEAGLKQQLDSCLPSKIIIKDGLENIENSDCRLNNQQQTIYPVSHNNLPSEDESNKKFNQSIVHGENDLQKKQCKLMKEDKEVAPLPFLEKLESWKYKNKEKRIEELPEKNQIDEMCNQKCTAVVSKGQELSRSRKEDSKGASIRPLCKRQSSDKERTRRVMVVVKSKSDALRHGSMETTQSKKNEGYKIKQDSSETHIIKGPTYILNKRQTAGERKHKTLERPSNAVTNSSNNQAVRTEHNESGSSEPVHQNKGSFARTNLEKFAYPEERGNAWKYSRSVSDNSKTSKVQTPRGQFLKMYKTHSSGKETVWGTHKRNKCCEKTFSDKKPPCNRKDNILTLQREQKKNYLNKVAFKQTEQSICLTNLEQSPSKSVWHVKRSSTAETPKDQTKRTLSSPQLEVVKPMLEFKMCPEPVFRNLVSEEVSDTKKLPEKETAPIAAVKSKREDWLKYTPLKRRKIDDKETQVDDCIPLDTALQMLEKNEVLPVPAKDSNATFQTYRKMHLEKRSRSLDSSPLN
ncbi:retroelement silencing factor 1 [Eublepharis macularius]|uniref:Retroelement silencing factor 1 n=1 Tax=Eublepharis macularius TaxID=481883 RepID=A0AA97JR53_EUBMA|nr:retroelement silencing factor 1 [Eublepharis macularius]